MKRPFNVSDATLKHGWRSGLEEAVAADLQSHAVSYKYEELTIEYTYPEKLKRYTPDFELPNGQLIETKGRFVTADREKIKLIKKQFPQLDLRIVFSNPQARIGKTSKTTYAVWCDTLGIPWAKKLIPVSWVLEPLNVASQQVIAFLRDQRNRKAKK